MRKLITGNIMAVDPIVAIPQTEPQIRLSQRPNFFAFRNGIWKNRLTNFLESQGLTEAQIHEEVAGLNPHQMCALTKFYDLGLRGENLRQLNMRDFNENHIRQLENSLSRPELTIVEAISQLSVQYQPYNYNI